MIWSSLDLKLRLVDECRVERHLGSALRGCLLQGLKQDLCATMKLRGALCGTSCPRELEQGCPFHTLNNPVFPDNRRAPLPYALMHDPRIHSRDLPPDAQIPFRLILFGQLTRRADSFVEAFRRAGDRPLFGVSPKRSRYEIQRGLTRTFNAEGIEALVQRLKEHRRIYISTITPVRILRNREPLQKVTLMDLLRAAQERAVLLQACYGELHVPSMPEITNDDPLPLTYYTEAKHSRLRDPFGGVQGVFALDTPSETTLRLLAWGQAVGIGAGTTLGLGWIQVSSKRPERQARFDPSVLRDPLSRNV